MATKKTQKVAPAVKLSQFFDGVDDEQEVVKETTGTKAPPEWTEAYQILWVRGDDEALPCLYSYGITPSDKVLRAAVRSFWHVICDVDNPSEELQLLCVRTHEYINNCQVPWWIVNPTEKVLLAMLKKAPEMAEHDIWKSDNKDEIAKQAQVNYFRIRDTSEAVKYAWMMAMLQ